MSGDRAYNIRILIAHHNCPKMANSSNPARPVMQRTGTDYPNNNSYYQCPACETEIMLHTTIREADGGTQKES